MLLHLRARIESSGDTRRRLFDLNGSIGSPYALREGIARDKSSFFMLEHSWNTNEAQEFPFGVENVDSNGMVARSLEGKALNPCRHGGPCYEAAQPDSRMHAHASSALAVVHERLRKPCPC